MESIVMATATAELLNQLSGIIISAVASVVGYYLKKFMETNRLVKEYNLYNEKVERTLDNAIMYAETKFRHQVGNEISKRQFAISYLDMIDPEIIATNGGKLELMLDRKVEQVLKKKTPVKRKTKPIENN